MSKAEPTALSCDVAVIGSGPGGAVTAALCAEAGLDVLLLEEGPDLPLESAPHFSREEVVQKYRSAGINIAFGSAKIAYVEGRCVGGGSEINRGLYYRTPDFVLENWRRDFKVDDLTVEALREHFEACEGTARVEYLPGPAPAVSRRLQEGADRLGWECVEAPRLFRYASDYPNGQAATPGRKQSMSATFVPRFQAAGGRLLAEARASRLRRENGKWRILVEKGQARRPVEVVADTVFVTCGAVETPALLRRSGFKRNIGDGLRFHPMIKVVARFPDELNMPGDLEPVHQIKEFDPRFSMGASMSRRPALAMAMEPHRESMQDVDRDWRRMGIYYVQNTGGIGTVRNLPAFRSPLVRVRQSRADLAELAEGLRRLCECLFAAGAEVIFPSLPGYPPVRSQEDIERMPESLPPERANTTALHLFSSCPMGEDEERCAADSFGRLRGTDNLLISDSSLLCSPTVVNPQGSVMAIAHRNATAFLERVRGRRRADARYA